jgi:broad specificity phosphatase PhoE
MGTIYLVRHGQASFGADDYDQLSALGWHQSIRLGEYWKAHGLGFQSIMTGTLRRHAETLEGIAQGLGATWTRQAWSEWNEFDSKALLDALHAPPLPDPRTAEGYRLHFRHLRMALQQWAAGLIAPRGMPTYADFTTGIRTSLELARRESDGNVLIVTSGGPISTAVGQLLGTSSATTIDLNLRLRNTSITEIAVTPRRLALVSFNGLPHLSSVEHRDWITHA